MEYSIGEFSRLTGLGIHTLRYYEQEGLIAPERNSGNRRRYSDRDIAWISFIKRLKDTGMPIKEIKRYAQLRAEGNPTLQARLEILVQHRQAFQEFNGPFIITQGGPRNSTMLISMLIYNNAFKSYEMGLASAQAWLLFLIVMTFTAIAFFSQKHWVYYSDEDGR